MNITRYAAPTTTPVDLDEVKAHLRVDFSDDDPLITALIDAATSYLDGWTGILGRAMITQTWELALDDFPADAIYLPLGPLQSVASITYIDATGLPQTVPSVNYYVDTKSLDGWVVPNADTPWPETMYAPNVVTVRFVCGYGDAPAVPQAIKQAMLLLIGHWYENREGSIVGTSVAELPLAVSALLAPFRRVTF